MQFSSPRQQRTVAQCELADLAGGIAIDLYLQQSYRRSCP
jgi:hypothetical protein